MTKIFLYLSIDEMGNLFIKGSNEKCFELLQNVLTDINENDLLKVKNLSLNLQTNTFSLFDYNNRQILKSTPLGTDLPKCINWFKERVELFDSPKIWSIDVKFVPLS